MDEVLKRHEDTLKFMFVRVWTNSAWTPQDEEEAQAMLASELLPGEDLCLFTSAVTLSLMESFDVRKIMWLLDAYSHSNVSVSQRALVGVMIIFHIYRNRLIFYPEILKRVDFMDEIPTFRKEVARVYHQMLLCQETEKIDKKMREEIIPEMLKSVSSMKNMRFDLEAVSYTHLKEVEALHASNAEELEALRIKYLSKKGAINDLMADFRNVPAEQKKEVGMRLNELKTKAQDKILSLIHISSKPALEPSKSCICSVTI